MADTIKGPLTATANIALDTEIALNDDGNLEVQLYLSGSDTLLATKSFSIGGLIEEYVEANTCTMFGREFMNDPDAVKVLSCLKKLSGDLIVALKANIKNVNDLWVEK